MSAPPPAAESMRSRPSSRADAVRAYATHAFTATGAIFALLALLEAVEGRYARMFVWLVVAFVVDGVDGALARRYEVGVNAPIIDGVILDLVIDFLTYVLVPVFALLRAGLLPGRGGHVTASLVVFASALYFADTRMKTPDRSFAGFPACWNMLALVVFATTPSPRITMVVVLVLAAAMFTRIRFVHPVRTVRWRWLSLPVAVVWTALAGWAGLAGLTLPAGAQVALLVTSLHLLTVGAVQQAMERWPRGRASGPLG
jgi:phosphatidylcholine synthase